MSSRYASLQTVEPSELNARSELAPRRLPDVVEVEKSGRTWEYPVTEGERIDQIAYRVLGDSRQWHAIADLNPDIDPLELVGGTRLLMPRIQDLD